MVRSVDILDLTNPVKWNLFEDGNELLGRESPLVNPLNESQILVMGGFRDGVKLSDAFLFDVELSRI